MCLRLSLKAANAPPNYSGNKDLQSVMGAHTPTSSPAVFCQCTAILRGSQVAGTSSPTEAAADSHTSSLRFTAFTKADRGHTHVHEGFIKQHLRHFNLLVISSDHTPHLNDICRISLPYFLRASQLNITDFKVIDPTYTENPQG